MDELFFFLLIQLICIKVNKCLVFSAAGHFLTPMSVSRGPIYFL